MSGKDWWQRARKPFGGFIFMTVTQLCMVWWCYRQRHIRDITLKELRVWFAAWEMIPRRCELKPGDKREFTPREVNNLISGGGAKQAIENLLASGLLQEFSEASIRFATSPEQLKVGDVTGLEEMIDKVRNNDRRVPVPRQIVRLIASVWKPTVIATALGHLFTGFYYKAKLCVSGGYCKAADIADLFELDIRNIKAARKFLAEGLTQKASGLSWLILQETPQWKLNRFGQGFVINLEWKRQDLEAGRAVTVSVKTAPKDAAKQPPPPTQNDAKSPPPYITKNPIQELNNKTRLERGDDDTSPHHANTKPASGGSVVKKLLVREENKAPTLDKLIDSDLTDTDRAKALYQQAVERGLVEATPKGLVNFFALIGNAKLRGAKNPCGYFVKLLRIQAWNAITDDDRVNAKRRLGLPVRERPDRVVVTAQTGPGNERDTTPASAEEIAAAQKVIAREPNPKMAKAMQRLLDLRKSGDDKQAA